MIEIDKSPYRQRVATNLVGVVVGYSAVIIDVLSSQPVTEEDLEFALFGALLIPVISRLTGAENRKAASSWFLKLLFGSSILFTAVAFTGYGLIVVSKKHWGPVSGFLQLMVSACYYAIPIGLIADVALVAAEEERHEPQIGIALRKIVRRHLPFSSEEPRTSHPVHRHERRVLHKAATVLPDYCGYRAHHLFAIEAAGRDLRCTLTSG